MSGAVLVAVAAAIGNLLQGWDNATIAGSILYIKREMKLESEPTVEGLIVAMSLIGATLVTTFSGALSDSLGRRPMLIISALLYFVSSLVMLWSPNVYILLLARLLDGFGIGLAVTLVPLYISETAPPEIRGLLNTLPQFTGSAGMFFSYCMVFGMSLMDNPSWRLMLGVLSIPSLIYFALAVFFLPESPRWLVSKGRMLEAKKVLQRLRGREDVAGEMALLVEGLGVGGDTAIEEYIIGPANELTDEEDPSAGKDQIKLYGPEQGLSWVAKPVTGNATGLVSRQGSMANQSGLVDPLVTLFGSIHEKLPETGSMRSTLFPHFGSMFSVGGNQPRNEDWEEESLAREGDDYASDAGGGDSDDNLHSPLISRQTTSLDKDMPPPAHGSLSSMRQGSLLQGNAGEPAGSMGIGGGWQLAWKWSEREGPDGKREGGFKRIYLHQEGGPGSRRGSLVSLPGGDLPADGEVIQAAALVSQPALYNKELLNQQPVGPAMVHPSETAAKGPSWSDLFEPGVKHALIVGVGIQILQQFSGINGVLYYTPQILEQAGVGFLLSNLGLSSTSASFLISAVTTLLMLPCIAVAMRLMDISGRRALLLSTLPVLITSLLILVTGSLVNLGSTVNASISTISVVVYFCCFVMGFGPIPNILCAEIFPTRVRGLCIAICALTFWIGDIIVTYSLPVMLNSVGLAGVFGMYAVVCLIAWAFVFMKVPETKGMPLEVIIEFFSVGAKQADSAKNN
ncbi:monosaccharide-sensing protein 2-like isoform X1 [Prosopis cineraria]|uniref:monosaccharide-sensing protein 2-like isoform X1 n=1 Tax=Prosopis cineraria TaxID=364024 RepID=UPI0024109159|nr:monosaccharide-sensing protein 2-like isoform X1 [Prosopis cineraria]XP_054787016.1 monosaccharide-sensing protein 2-like isoform X1 [Prosopis cineraria]XP_054787017.1 monosaccharide-sensing protein 2-like isoform X1 [Prosopis cineraria]XP_054787018.1 monosaccharide-sensing protein 2-like isoform X1 [Prosopis cineraria]XP_054787019.1 monosaccharide-sensing protein 2-like isoform X1 [Prosopis cineraria]XP_054787020.1 monosaccharide-sensing protein 2-like isoform X1 [Prosopis cineraria]